MDKRKVYHKIYQLPEFTRNFIDVVRSALSQYQVINYSSLLYKHLSRTWCFDIVHWLRGVCTQIIHWLDRPHRGWWPRHARGQMAADELANSGWRRKLELECAAHWIQGSRGVTASTPSRPMRKLIPLQSVNERRTRDSSRSKQCPSSPSHQPCSFAATSLGFLHSKRKQDRVRQTR